MKCGYEGHQLASQSLRRTEQMVLARCLQFPRALLQRADLRSQLRVDSLVLDAVGSGRGGGGDRILALFLSQEDLEGVGVGGCVSGCVTGGVHEGMLEGVQYLLFIPIHQRFHAAYLLRERSYLILVASVVDQQHVYSLLQMAVGHGYLVHSGLVLLHFLFLMPGSLFQRIQTRFLLIHYAYWSTQSST